MDGPPLRPRPVWVFVVMVVLTTLAWARPLEGWAQAPLLPNGDFESGLDGWQALPGAAVTLEEAGGVVGPHAVRITAQAPGRMRLLSRWWEGQPVTAGAEYTLDAWVLDDDPTAADVRIAVEFVDGAGVRTGISATAWNPGDAPTFRPLSVTATAPAGSEYARASVEADADASGATFLLDGVALRQTGVAPEVTPTLQPPPTAPATPVATVSATPTVTSAPTPMQTATPTPPVLVRPLGPEIWNGTFEFGDDAWEARRGSVVVSHVLGGAWGKSLVLTAESGVTAWVEQGVLVVPGGWYQAQALLAPLNDVGAAWVRIAWYTTADASGTQIVTADSALLGEAGNAIAVTGAGEQLTTGAVRAPSVARSARVRILLQPAIAGAALAVDNVVFEAAEAPPAPSPAATATPPPVSMDQPSPTPASPQGAGAGDSSGGASGTSPPSSSPALRGSPEAVPAEAVPVGSVSAEVVSAQSALRITEVMADPVASGRDFEHEWVEITNFGAVPVDMGGMRLRDGQGETWLPSMVVPPGASVVVAGRLAEVDADARLDGPIGNGLGNTGDRLDLVDARGAAVDAVVYGAGTGLAPATGESIQRWFDRSAVLLGEGVGPPSAGVHAVLEVSSAPEAETPETTVTEGGAVVEAGNEQGGTDADPMAWMLVIAIGGGALGGVAMQRLSSRRQ